MISLRFAMLHAPLFLPGPGGKGVNLKNNLDTENVDGKEKGLKMTLEGDLVYIEAGGAFGYIPTTNFMLLVPKEKLGTAAKAK